MQLALTHPLTFALNYGRDSIRYWNSCGNSSSGTKNGKPRAHVRDTVDFGHVDCRGNRPRYMRKYIYHPVPNTLAMHFNSTRDCLKAPSACYGLLRINVKERCYNVQARIAGYWRELADRPLRNLHHAKYLSSWLDATGVQRLRQTNALYSRCVGLAANESCLRVAGDLKLFSAGRHDAACLRHTWNGSCSALGNAVPTPSVTTHAESHVDAQRGGSRCILQG